MTLVNSLARHLALALALAILTVAINGAYAADGKAADDIAHFIAGMPPSADSPLASLTGEAEWKRHAAFFNTSWKEFEDKNLSKGEGLVHRRTSSSRRPFSTTCSAAQTSFTRTPFSQMPRRLS